MFGEWRYQHWDSNSSAQQKRATVQACLRKVQAMASDPKLLSDAALDKIAEFRRLCYPLSDLRKTCNFPRSVDRGGHVDHRKKRTPIDTETVQRPVVGRNPNYKS